MKVYVVGEYESCNASGMVIEKGFYEKEKAIEYIYKIGREKDGLCSILESIIINDNCTYYEFVYGDGTSDYKQSYYFGIDEIEIK